MKNLRGILSLILFIASCLGIFALMLFEPSGLIAIFGLLLVLLLGFSLVGLIVGASAMTYKEEDKIIASVGIGLNLCFIVFFVGLMILKK